MLARFNSWDQFFYSLLLSKLSKLFLWGLGLGASVWLVLG